MRCEWTTPLGSRVVPEVKPTMVGASGSTWAGPVIGSDASRVSKAVAAAGRLGPGVSPTTSQSGTGRWANSSE